MEERIRQIRHGARGQRISVFAGSIFRDSDIRTNSDVSGAPPLQVPQWYWSIAVWVTHRGQLRSIGYFVPNYVVDENGAIDGDPTDEFTEEYNQVPISVGTLPLPPSPR